MTAIAPGSSCSKQPSQIGDSGVSERLGHAKTAFTIETYQHVLPGMPADAASLFGQLIGSSTGDTRWNTRQKST